MALEFDPMGNDIRRERAAERAKQRGKPAQTWLIFANARDEPVRRQVTIDENGDLV